jgi:serine/threonine protein phosphatase PrpC
MIVFITPKNKYITRLRPTWKNDKGGEDNITIVTARLRRRQQ